MNNGKKKVMNLMGRSPLPEGTKLICEGGGVYTICGDPIGCGGSSIVYAAKREGECSSLAVKELYPCSDKIPFCRTDGVVSAVDLKQEEYLNQLAENMTKEKEYSQKIFSTTICVVHVQERLRVRTIFIGENSFDGSKGYFFLMDNIQDKGISLPKLLNECAKPWTDGYPLRTGGLPNIHTTAQIMAAVLEAVIRISMAGKNHGFLHGDIQKNNIFFQNYDLKNGSIGIACMLDLGCMKPLLEDGKTAPVKLSGLFSTPGYIPPELLFADENIRIGPQADIYALGRLMLIMLTGREYGNKKFDPVYSNDSLRMLLPSEAENIGCDETVRDIVNEILQKATCFEPEDRYADAGEMKKDIDFLVQKTKPGGYAMEPNLPDLDSFMGREEELEQLEQMLQNGSNPVWIYGFGGIGKTELAIRFGLMQRRKGRQVYRLSFVHSLRETIASMEIKGDQMKQQTEYQNSGPDSLMLNDNQKQKTKKKREQHKILIGEEDLYRHNLALLSQHFKGAIFIIDNVDPQKGRPEKLLGDAVYQELIRQDFSLVFTTRYDMGDLGVAALEVGTLPEKILEELFYRFYQSAEDGCEETVRVLIRKVRGHTLTVELMARILQEDCDTLTPEELLKSLKKNGLEDDNLPKVVSNQNREYRQRYIYGHIRSLFKISKLRKEEKAALVRAAFLPEEGLDRKIYMKCETSEGRKAMKKTLLPRGWVSDDDNRKLHVHPLIRELCFRELKDFMKLKYFTDILGNMELICEKAEGESYPIFSGMGKYLENAGRMFQDFSALRYASEAYIYSGEYGEAISLLEENIPECRKENPIQEAALCQNLGYVYCIVGDAQKGMPFARRAVELRKKHLPADALDLATAYNGLAVAYQEAGQYRQSLEYNIMALNIVLENRKADSFSKASAFSNVASNYEAMEDYEQALKSIDRAIMYGEQAFPDGHPVVGGYYATAGRCCCRLEQYDKGENCLNTALKHFRKYLTPNQRDVVSCLRDLSMVYQFRNRDAEDMEKAMDYCREAQQYSEQCGVDILQINCTQNYAYLLSINGRSEEAYVMEKKAYDLLSRSSRPDLKAIAESCCSLADYAGNCGLDHEASDWAGMRRQIRQLLPFDASEMAMAWHEEGYRLLQCGQLEEALQSLAEAETIYRSYELDQPYNLASTLYIIAVTRQRLGEHEAAVAYAEESVQMQFDCKSEDRAFLANSYGCLGRSLYQLGRLSDCMVCWYRQWYIYREEEGQSWNWKEEVDAFCRSSIFDAGTVLDREEVRWAYRRISKRNMRNHLPLYRLSREELEELHELLESSIKTHYNPDL